MLRKLALLTCISFVLAPLLSAQTVDEIIAKNIQARGGMDKIKAVNTIRSTGTMTMGPGMEAPGSMIVKRPDMARLEFTVQGLTAVQAYDGKDAWQIMPFTGKKDPEAMSADDKKDLEENADIDGPLVDYKSKGNKVELLGKEKLEGTDAYKLKVTLKNGDVITMYLDADSYLEVKEETKRIVRGTEREVESVMGDYKDVNGLMFAFAVENGVKGGQEKEKLTISKIELNVPVDNAIFKMPPPAPKAQEPKK
ncbi:MAG: outer membrane lipoprotein-sorting protein [Acidobacteriota bacterium]|nr:outer membrane lipoprotein-sorting protein [Acidobacteriota bacterium]